MNAIGPHATCEPPSQRELAAAVRTCVQASDPVSRAGVTSQLQARRDVRLVDGGDAGCAPDVVVVVCEQVDLAALAAVRRSRPARVLLVASTIGGPEVLAAVEAGVHGLLRRSEATAERLAGAILAVAAGDGTLPPDLLGRLLGQVGARRGLTYGGLTQRELEVLSLLAGGCSTAEIARKLAYSERTIKNAIHDLVTRLQLRNRTHAVAFAVREGLI